MSAIFSIRSALVAALILPPAGYAQLRTSGIVTARPLGPAPANLTAGPAASGGARLVWQPVSGAVYRVYRSTDPTVQGAELLGSPVTVLEFLDGTALPGATFYYRVAADYADGRLGTAGPVAFTAATPGAGTLTLSNPGTCGTATRYPVSAPANVTVTATPTSATLGWAPPLGAVWYEVARTGPTGVRTVVTPAGFSGVTITDAGLDPRAGYRYDVTAIGAACDRATAQASVTTPPPTNPKGLVASVTLHNVQAQISPTLNVLSTASGDVTLNWTPVAGAASYEISGPGLSLPRIVPAPPFTIVGVAPAKVTYAVVANFFNSVNRRFADLSSPSTVAVRVGAEPVKAWMSPGGGGSVDWGVAVSGYPEPADVRLFIGFRVEGPYSDITRAGFVWPYNLRDPERRTGQTVWYRVLAVYRSGPVAWTDPLKSTQTGKYIPAGLKATVRPGSILVSWDPHPEVRYTVGRIDHSSSDQNFKDLGARVDGITYNTVWEDRTVRAGVRYTYEVCVLPSTFLPHEKYCPQVSVVAQ